MNSFNHYAYGAIGAWLYASVAGIDIDPQNPGYKHILFKPHPGKGLTAARAFLHSMYGGILSDWRISEGKFEWEVIVPPNTNASIYLPGSETPQEVGSGQYHFSQEWNDSDQNPNLPGNPQERHI